MLSLDSGEMQLSRVIGVALVFNFNCMLTLISFMLLDAVRSIPRLYSVIYRLGLIEPNKPHP